MTSQPWIKFYPADWRGDEGLKIVSLAARGLWIDMITLMHKGSPFGHLVINSIPLDAAKLGRAIGSTPKEVSKCLEELEQAGVFSRTADGTIYSRRMVRDRQKDEIDHTNGRRGGNPKLAHPDNPNSTGGVNPPDNPNERNGLTPTITPAITPPITSPLTDGLTGGITGGIKPRSQKLEARKKELNLSSDAETACTEPAEPAGVPSEPSEPTPIWPPQPLASSASAVVGGVVASLTGRRRSDKNPSPIRPVRSVSEQISAVKPRAQTRGTLTPQQLAEAWSRVLTAPATQAVKPEMAEPSSPSPAP